MDAAMTGVRLGRTMPLLRGATAGLSGRSRPVAAVSAVNNNVGDSVAGGALRSSSATRRHQAAQCSVVASGRTWDTERFALCFFHYAERKRSLNPALRKLQGCCGIDFSSGIALSRTLPSCGAVMYDV